MLPWLHKMIFPVITFIIFSKVKCKILLLNNLLLLYAAWIMLEYIDYNFSLPRIWLSSFIFTTKFRIKMKNLSKSCKISSDQGCSVNFYLSGANDTIHTDTNKITGCAEFHEWRKLKVFFFVYIAHYKLIYKQVYVAIICILKISI